MNSQPNSHTHCQAAQANAQTKAWQRVCLSHPAKIELKKSSLPSENKNYVTAQQFARKDIYNASKELERTNQLLRAKYDNDAKYARLHKRLMEKDPLTDSESKLFEALQSLKKEVDAQIVQNSKMMENESYVERMMVKMVIEQSVVSGEIEIVK